LPPESLTMDSAGGQPPDSRYRLALRARHIGVHDPQSLLLDPPLNRRRCERVFTYAAVVASPSSLSTTLCFVLVESFNIINFFNFAL